MSLIGNSTFWLSMGTIITGFMAILGGVCLKSKCAEISFLGLHIKRDVGAELRQHEFDVEHGLVEGLSPITLVMSRPQSVNSDQSPPPQSPIPSNAPSRDGRSSRGPSFEITRVQLAVIKGSPATVSDRTSLDSHPVP